VDQVTRRKDEVSQAKGGEEEKEASGSVSTTSIVGRRQDYDDTVTSDGKPIEAEDVDTLDQNPFCFPATGIA
jgi:hypothetical protein